MNKWGKKKNKQQQQEKTSINERVKKFGKQVESPAQIALLSTP